MHNNRKSGILNSERNEASRDESREQGKADQRGALTKHILAVNQTRWERLLWISDCSVPQDERGGREKGVMAKGRG